MNNSTSIDIFITNALLTVMVYAILDVIFMMRAKSTFNRIGKKSI